MAAETMDLVMEISPAEFVIRKFGGLTKTANALGLAVTTVQGWGNRGRVPQEHWLPIIAAASEIDETIDLSDFLRTHVAPASKETAA